MRLFDDLARADRGPLRHGQSRFEYLNTSARPYVGEIRDQYERWFAAYPDREKPRLRGDFRSARDDQHRAAEFELIVYAVLESLGMRPEVHPAMRGGVGVPDFLAHAPDGSAFYVEAACAEPSERKRLQQENRDALRAGLDALTFPAWILSLQVESVPDTRATVRCCVRAVEQWLGRLDLLRSEGRSRPDDLVFEWHQGGWDIQVRAVRRAPPVSGQRGHLVGVWSLSPGLEGAERISAKVRAKAKKYGDAGRPLVLALNVLDEHLDEIDIMEGLFGSEQWRGVQGPEGTDVRLEGREGDGGWYRPQGLKNSSISAVWVCEDMGPVALGKRPEVLVHHPRARYPLPVAWWPLSQLVPDPVATRLVPRAGRNLREVMALAEAWPSMGDEA